MALPHRSLAFLLAAFAVHGCAAPVRPPGPGPGVVAPAPQRDALAEPWLVRPAHRSWTHRIQLDAVLDSRVDSAERSDTLLALVVLTWSPVAGTTPAQLSGLITAFRLASGVQAEPTTPPGLKLPVPFSADLGFREGQARIVQPPPEDCGVPAAAAQTLRELFLAVPETLTAGMAWRDRADYVICRDSIRLSVHSERRYLVLGAEWRGDEVVVRLERRSTSTMSGSGTQYGEFLAVEAGGTGTMVFEVSLAGGVPVAGTGESELAMTMRGRRRSQELQQRTRISITSSRD